MKNKILKASVRLAVIILMIAISLLDSENFLPFIIIAIISFGYIVLYTYVN